MFFEKLHKGLIGNSFIAIEVFTHQGNQTKYAISLIKKTKDELAIIDSKILETIDLDGLQKQKLPITVIVNTNKVLNKTLDFVEKNEISAFKKAFSTLNIEDFYFDLFNENGKTIIYLSRKDYINDIINSFKQIESLIINLSIGSSTIENILPYLKSVDKINFNFGTLTLKQLFFSTESPENNAYFVNNINLMSQNILGFSSVISLLNKKQSGNLDSLNTHLKNNFLQSGFFKKIAVNSVYFFLGVLLINYFIFSYYFEKYNELIAVKEIIDSKTKKIELLSKNIYEKEQLLKNIGTIENKPSFVINEINKTIPSSILLNEFTFYPITKKQKDESLAEFEENSIIISGITTNNEEFSSWLTSINDIDLIKSTSIIDFGEKESKTNFTLKIKLDETK